MNKVERDQHRRDMKHPRTRIRRVLTAPLMDGEVSIAAEHKKWHDAFGAVVAYILAGYETQYAPQIPPGYHMVAIQKVTR